MRGYRVPSSLIDKIERESLHIGDFSYTDGMDKVIDAIKDLGEVELDNPWHTGEPTEEGWYLIQTEDDDFMAVEKNEHGLWFVDSFGCSKVNLESIVAWKKIEPYKED